MEYIITSGTRHLVLPTKTTKTSFTGSLLMASKFKNKQRAETIARVHPGFKVEPFWGAEAPRGSKFFTMPKQSPVNRRSAYRSI